MFIGPSHIINNPDAFTRDFHLDRLNPHVSQIVYNVIRSRNYRRICRLLHIKIANINCVEWWKICWAILSVVHILIETIGV